MKRKLITFSLSLSAFIRMYRFSQIGIRNDQTQSVDYRYFFVRIYEREKEGLAVGFLSGFLTDVFWETLSVFTPCFFR